VQGVVVRSKNAGARTQEQEQKSFSKILRLVFAIDVSPHKRELEIFSVRKVWHVLFKFECENGEHALDDAGQDLFEGHVWLRGSHQSRQGGSAALPGAPSSCSCCYGCGLL
jgi:hypothetical protein